MPTDDQTRRDLALHEHAHHEQAACAGCASPAEVRVDPGYQWVAGRRALLGGAGAVGLAALLAACGGSTDTAGEGSSGDTASPPDTTSPPGTGAPQSPSGDSGTGEVLAQTSEIPEGGGKVFKGLKVVVTQPTAGSFKAFSAVCRHQGCLVDTVRDGVISCPCHGSTYDIADGSVRNGPATRALPTVNITVEGANLLLG